MKLSTEVVLGHDQDTSGTWNQYASAIIDNQLHFGRKSTVETSRFDFAGALGSMVFTKNTYGYFFDPHLEAAAHVQENRGNRCVYISVAAKTPEAAIDYMNELKSKTSPEVITDESLVNINFWSMTNYGGSFRSRKLAVPAWEDIVENYPEETRNELTELMDQDFRPGSGGQLVLWYGEPGTGKTTALRALAREWKDWCNVEYIADPEKFFGSETDYMLSVLINEDGDDVNPWDQNYADNTVPDPSSPKWRLLVLEDAGELLAHDAKMLSGAGLGRFLNVVDGLIGQGLKIIVLVTTNEELGNFHDAVSRPGRCLAQINFASFKKDEASEWLRTKNASITEVSESKTLAELYAKLHNYEYQASKHKTLTGFGFGT